MAKFLLDIRTSKANIPSVLIMIPQKGAPYLFLLAKNCGINLSFARPKATCPSAKNQAFRLLTETMKATMEMIKYQLPGKIILSHQRMVLLS